MMVFDQRGEEAGYCNSFAAVPIEEFEIPLTATASAETNKFC
jgi:hypothetical protein